MCVCCVCLFVRACVRVCVCEAVSAGILVAVGACLCGAGGLKAGQQYTVVVSAALHQRECEGGVCV